MAFYRPFVSRNVSASKVKTASGVIRSQTDNCRMQKKDFFYKKKTFDFARFECRKKIVKHGQRQTNSSGVISDVNLEF